MRTASDIIGDDVENAVIAQHRDQLSLIGIRAAIVRAEVTAMCRCSRWHTRRAQRLPQKRVLRGVRPKEAPRSRARLVLVKPAKR